MRQGDWGLALGRLLRSWRWSGPLLFVLCLTNVPSLIQREMFEGASLAFLPRAGLLAEEAVRVAGLSLLVTLVCGFLPRLCRRLLACLGLFLAAVHRSGMAHGLHLALGTAWVFLVAGEMVGAQSGLGFLIIDARNNLRADLLMAAIITIGVLGLLLDGGVTLVERAINRRFGSRVA